MIKMTEIKLSASLQCLDLKFPKRYKIVDKNGETWMWEDDKMFKLDDLLNTAYVVDESIKQGMLGDTYLDVLVIHPSGYRVGFEVALSPQYEIVNLEKAIRAGLEHIIVVSPEKEILEKIRAKAKPLLEENPNIKVEFRLIDKYLE